MIETIQEAPSPQICAGKIFKISGTQLDPDAAAALRPKILQHKWLMPEKYGRDAGLRTACIDFVKYMEQTIKDYVNYRREYILVEMAAQAFGRELRDTISDSQPWKQLVQRRIILSLTERKPLIKHGIIPPKTMIFLEFLGTGKTHFVKAIAGVLS